MARRALPWLTRRYRVYALVRSVADDADLRALGVTLLRADLDRRASLKRLAGIADLVLHFAPPSERGQHDARTRRLVWTLAAARSLPRRIVYISTTGVYGDCGGALVTETRTPRPQTDRARRRLDAEAALRRFARARGVGVSVLRAPGIYAAQRLPLARIERGDPVLRADEDVYTNHVHADDLARLACLALTRGRPSRVYNACDDAHLRMGEYFDLVADAYALPRPPRMTRAQAAARLSPMALSFMSESRRLLNSRLKRELRVSLRYADVRAGIAAARTESKQRESQ